MCTTVDNSVDIVYKRQVLWLKCVDFTSYTIHNAIIWLYIAISHQKSFKSQ